MQEPRTQQTAPSLACSGLKWPGELFETRRLLDAPQRPEGTIEAHSPPQRTHANCWPMARLVFVSISMPIGAGRSNNTSLARAGPTLLPSCPYHPYFLQRTQGEAFVEMYKLYAHRLSVWAINLALDAHGVTSLGYSPGIEST